MLVVSTKHPEKTQVCMVHSAPQRNTQESGKIQAT